MPNGAFHRHHDHPAPGVSPRVFGPALGLAAVLALPGCVRRTIEITSSPPGALVVLNDREVGRTPVDVEFTFYGDYDVRLSLDGYEPLVTSGKASPPLWDSIPFDFLAEIFAGDIESRILWHYVLEPAKNDEAGLLERAAELRRAVEGGEPADLDADQAADQGADAPE